jgi:hypothetical protein
MYAVRVHQTRRHQSVTFEAVESRPGTALNNSSNLSPPYPPVCRYRAPDPQHDYGVHHQAQLPDPRRYTGQLGSR